MRTAVSLADAPDCDAVEVLVTASHIGVAAADLARFPRLRILARAAAGLENLDEAAARERGIRVVSAPEANAQSAAELTMALMFAVARRLTHHDPALREGRWSRNESVGFELAGRRLGIIGLGRVGTRVARMAGAIPMELSAYDPFLDAVAFSRARCARAETVEELAARSDVLTLHCPLTDATRGMVGVDVLERLSEDSVVLNCARGGIVDESALARMIESGRLGGAGIDCWETEPLPPGHPLLEIAGGRVVVMPHAGARTAEARDRAAVETAAGIAVALGEL